MKRYEPVMSDGFMFCLCIGVNTINIVIIKSECVYGVIERKKVSFSDNLQNCTKTILSNAN